MVSGNIDELDHLLDNGFTLTHMSGYRQPKQEWLKELGQGQFDYHDIENQNVNSDGDDHTARVYARTICDATVYGVHAPWHLQLTVDYVHRGDAWIALQAVGTQW